MLRRRSTRTLRAAVTPPMTHRNSAGTSWDTGCRPITIDRIMAAIMETRPFKSTVSIIARNGRITISGCCGKKCATAAACSSTSPNNAPTSET